MKKVFTIYNPYFFLAISLVFFAMFLFSIIFVQAASVDDIEFPVAELGNCGSQEACEVYCDRSGNMVACLDFAEEKDLLDKEEIEKGRKMAELGINKGPGGCQSEASCEAYCNNQSNMRECIAFAKENGLMPAEELAEAEMVLAALDKGASLPGGCANKDKCEAYCEDESHLDECMEFALAAGFMTPEEAEMVKKTGGKGPGNCRGKNECDAFCEDPNNMEECISFGLQYGLMSPEEAREAEQVLKALKAGAKMPNCRGERECDEYCSQPEHMAECMDFAIAAGFMSEEDAEQARKMMEAGFTSGPGGCNNEEECEAFCDNPDNMEECLEFTYKIGEMTEEEYKEALENKDKNMMGGPGGCKTREECEAYCQDPAHMEECTQAAVESGDMTQEEYDNKMQMMEMKEEYEGMVPAGDSEGMPMPSEGNMPQSPESYPSPDDIEQMKNEIIEGEMQKVGEQIEEIIPPMTGENNMQTPEDVNQIPEQIPEEIPQPPTEQQIEEIIEDQIQEEMDKYMEQIEIPENIPMP